MAQVSVVERRIWNVDRREWDRFAEQHRASYRLSTSHLRPWALKRALRARVRLFEVYREGPGGAERVAQCAVGSSSGRHVFLDRLVVADDEPWSEIMGSVLQALGAGSCQYGWVLSMDPPREEELRAIPGVRVTDVRELLVDRIDFSDWPNWDEYWRAISTNVRRNVKKATGEIDGLRLEVRTGRSALRQVPAIVRLRAAMYRRKNLPFRPASATVSAVANILSCSQYALTALATSTAGPLAAFNGMTFAGDTYYAEGGSESSNHGASWYLMTQMVERAYTAHPSGSFIMGYMEPSLHDEEVGGGLLRSRRSLRARSHPGSIVTFQWSPR